MNLAALVTHQLNQIRNRFRFLAKRKAAHHGGFFKASAQNIRFKEGEAVARSNLFTRTLTLPNGKRKYFYGKTPEEAEKKLQKAKFELGLGIDISSSITFGELAETWYHIYKKPRLKSPNSRSAVLNVLNNHLLPYLADLQIRKITAANIQATLNAMNGLSASIQNKALQHLRSIFQLAMEEGIISKSPITMAVRTNGKPTEEAVPLTVEQARRLIDAVAGTNAEPFIKIGLWSGLRRGEILGLQWADVDLDDKVIHVRHNALLQDNKPTIVSDALKTAKSKRDVPIPDVLATYLTGLQAASKSKYVVPMSNGEPMTKNAFRAMWRLIENRTVHLEKDPETGKERMQELGSSPTNHGNVVRTLDFHVHPHLLRHTYITRLFDAGTDLSTVQYLAGHATPDITLRVYVHYLKTQKQSAAAEKVNQAFGNDV